MYDNYYYYLFFIHMKLLKSDIKGINNITKDFYFK